MELTSGTTGSGAVTRGLRHPDYSPGACGESWLGREVTGPERAGRLKNNAAVVFGDLGHPAPFAPNTLGTMTVPLLEADIVSFSRPLEILWALGGPVMSSHSPVMSLFHPTFLLCLLTSVNGLAVCPTLHKPPSVIPIQRLDK